MCLAGLDGWMVHIVTWAGILSLHSCVLGYTYTSNCADFAYNKTTYYEWIYVHVIVCSNNYVLA